MHTIQTNREEEEERIIREKEEAERRHFEGTRVSVDSFNTWRKQFEAEMRAKNEAAVKVIIRIHRRSLVQFPS